MANKKRKKIKEKKTNQISLSTTVWKTQTWSVLLIYVLLSLILYLRTLDYGYVLDDIMVASENKFTKNGYTGIKQILTTESFSGYFGEQKNLVQGSRYRPLSLITFNIEYQIFGPKPGISHLINALLYALACYLAFLALLTLFRETWTIKQALNSLAFVTCLIFLLHPLHVEAVANIKGRDEILSLLLGMSTMLFALRYNDTHKLFALLAMSICYLLGLLAKENTLTFLAIIPLGIFLFRERKSRKLVPIVISLFALSITYLLVRLQVIGFLIDSAPSDDIMNNAFAGMNGIEKYSTILYTLLMYLKLSVFPYPLTHDYYPYHIPIMNLGDWQVWLSVVLNLGLVFLFFFFWKKDKLVSFGIGFYFAALSIVSNIVISIGTFMNERFAFSASMGICILIACLIRYLNRSNLKPKPGYIILGIIMTGFALVSWNRIPAWKDPLSLNSAAIKVSQNSARANCFMATALFNKYQATKDRNEKIALLNQAEPYALRSVEIHPNYYNGNSIKAGVTAERYNHDKDLELLLMRFREIISLRPDVPYVATYLEYLHNRVPKNRLVTFYKNTAIDILLNQKKDYRMAIRYLHMGLQLAPNNPDFRRGMRTAYTGLGQPEKAKVFQ